MSLPEITAVLIAIGAAGAAIAAGPHFRQRRRRWRRTMCRDLFLMEDQNDN